MLACIQGVDSLIAPWVPPATDATPMHTLAQAIRAYQPGQGFIDGGGFQIVKESDSYLYVQFESIKKGNNKLTHKYSDHLN